MTGNLVLAEAKDSADIQAFFEGQTLPGQVDLRMHRPGNFFDLYRLQSDDHETILFREEDGSVSAVATLLFRQAWIRDRFETVGYLTDVRLSNSRRALRTWAAEFLDFLRQARTKRNCRYLFSIVSPIQDHAYNLLIRPKRIRENIPRYYWVQSLEVVTVLGKWPFYKSLKTLTLDQAGDKDLEEIVRYLRTRSAGRLLAFDYTPELLRERLRRWPNFKMENFLIARDARKNLVGCMAPWEAQDIIQYQVMAYNGVAQPLKSTLDWLALPRLTRKVPNPGERLRARFLTHAYADNADIFETLIFESLNDCGRNEFLCYANFEGDLLRRPPRSTMVTKMPLGLYTVAPPEAPLPEFLPYSHLEAPPEMELVLV